MTGVAKAPRLLARASSSWTAGRGHLPRVLAGLAIIAAGTASLASSFERGVWLPIEWEEAALAALAGALATWLAPDRGPSSMWYAGVAGALERPGRPAWAIRVVVVLTAPIAGFGVALYAAGGLLVSLTAPPSAARQASPFRTAATGFFGLAFVLAVGACGLTPGGDLGPLWPSLMIGAGLSLFWGAVGSPRRSARYRPFADEGVRTALGLLLALAGAAWVLSRSGLFRQAEGTIAGTVIALGVLALVVGPRWLRTSRTLNFERGVRARAEERAEMADHLHDSVLQTLALIQHRSDDPAEVAGLARRQERELRDWLLGRPHDGASLTLAAGLRGVAAEIEDDHRVEINVVTVGDAPLDEPIRAVVAAAREALTNAARHADGAAIFVFSRVESNTIDVFVHDRGPGFEIDAIPPQRRGIRESIVGRMDRVGGHAQIRTTPGGGCEVVLHLDRR